MIVRENQHLYQILTRGNILFLIGVFLLPSALAFSILFLLISLIYSLSSINFSKRENYSILVLLSVGLIFLSTFINTIINVPQELISYNKQTIWLNLFNWVPFVLICWGFRNYLVDIKQKIIFAKILISGTIPVLISCILQLWFGLDNGPYSTLNGILIWFQYPIEEVGSLTGLFSNQNITGMWLCINLALSLGLIKEEKNKISKYFLIAISGLSIYFIFLTNSRNAVIGLLIAIFLSTGLKKSFLILLSTLSGFFLTNVFHILLKNSNLQLIPTRLLNKLTFSYSFFEDRFIIWREALDLILIRPLSGWGGSTFSFLFPNNEIGFPAYHTHNMAIELAYSFGIPVSILIMIFIYKLTRKCYKKIFASNNLDPINIFNKSWFICFVIIVICHTTDMTFFDGRISIVLAILISGLVNLVNKPLEIKNKDIRL